MARALKTFGDCHGSTTLLCKHVARTIDGKTFALSHGDFVRAKGSEKLLMVAVPFVIVDAQGSCISYVWCFDASGTSTRPKLSSLRRVDEVPAGAAFTVPRGDMFGTVREWMKAGTGTKRNSSAEGRRVVRAPSTPSPTTMLAVKKLTPSNNNRASQKKETQKKKKKPTKKRSRQSDDSDSRSQEGDDDVDDDDDDNDEDSSLPSRAEPKQRKTKAMAKAKTPAGGKQHSKGEVALVETASPLATMLRHSADGTRVGNQFEQGMLVGALMEQLKAAKAALAAKEENDLMQKVFNSFIGK